MAYIPRLKKEYKEKIVPALTGEFGYVNVMEVPKLKKIVISKGVGYAVADKKLIDHALEELGTITGQKAIATISKKDVATFKLRKCLRVLLVNLLEINQTHILATPTRTFTLVNPRKANEMFDIMHNDSNLTRVLRRCGLVSFVS